MKDFKEYLEKHGVGEDYLLPYREYKYYAYRGGKVVFEGDTRAEAAEHGKVVERFWVNEEECRAADKLYRERMCAAEEEWKQDLKELTVGDTMSDTAFNILFNFAWAVGRSNGYRHVADLTEELVDLIESVNLANRQN